MTKQTLNELQAEVDRFQKRLNAAKDRIGQYGTLACHCGGTKESGQLKRAALDLKLELSKLQKTQY